MLTTERFTAIETIASTIPLKMRNKIQLLKVDVKEEETNIVIELMLGPTFEEVTCNGPFKFLIGHEVFITAIIELVKSKEPGFFSTPIATKAQTTTKTFIGEIFGVIESPRSLIKSTKSKAKRIQKAAAVTGTMSIIFTTKHGKRRCFENKCNIDL